ncbi:MAG: hypothetical protein RIA65_04875, partial [Woeseia sp.]
MKTFRPLAVFTTALLLTASHALAWEADTHYGLVKWLAYQAGFSLQDAELIAASSEGADETHVLMATYLITEVCARGKAPKLTVVSRVVQQHHFPSPDPVPASTQAREVLPGHYGKDGGGNRWIRQEIDDRTVQLSPLVRLDRFGSAIHPLADSWSHGGVPDTPSKFGIRCRQPELVWSNPATRGGWKKHDADLTYIYPQDANETAETIYRYMLDFLDAHKTYAQRPPAAWSSLRKRVNEFALRKTRDAKFGWFMEEDERYKNDNDEGLPYDRFLTYPCFLEETSLPKRDRREDYPRTRCADPELKDVMLAHGSTPPPAQLPLQPDPDSPWYFSYRLLETWLVRRDVPQVLNEMSNVLGIANAFATGPAAISDTDLVSTLMNMWLVDDHGAINALGHGGG